MQDKKNEIASTSCESCPTLNRSLFSEVKDPNTLRKLGRHKVCNQFKKGQVLFHEQGVPLGLFCLRSGKVKIYKTGPDGREQIVRLASPGDLIGYRSFLGEDSYSASAAVFEDSIICFIDKDDFRDVLTTTPNFTYSLIQLLSHELREAEDMIRDMAQKSVRERLAEVLLVLEKKFGHDETMGNTLSAILSREELASFVGTATETLIRLLSDMKDEGLVETQGRRIRLVDTAKLSAIAGLED